jgi:thiamine transport system substrate-binding protein
VRRLAIALAAVSLLAACSGADAEGPVRLVTYSSFPVEGTGANEALAAFTTDTGIAVEIVVAGDTGTMVAKAALTAGNPEGDVMWGVDNTFLSRAVEAEVFEAHRSPAAAVIDPALMALVPDDLVTPVDFGDVCVNYDIDALAAAGVDPPVNFADLADPAYRGLLAVQDPASSSPGLAFLIGTVVTFGDEWPAYWESLVANDVLVTDDWEEAYYGAFTRAGGDRPLVVSYGSPRTGRPNDRESDPGSACRPDRCANHGDHRHATTPPGCGASELDHRRPSQATPPPDHPPDGS